jgi:lipopolysaccharide export system permease protein
VTRFDRYFLYHLLVAFGFFSLVLVAVFWVNQAVLLFDKLIADGHSARIFLEFSILSLPEAISIVVPISSFAAAIYVTNRLDNESELTVVRAAGLGTFRLARPVFIFGILIAILMLGITNFVIPASKKQLHHREHQIASNLSAKLLREGSFVHPHKNLTIFIEDITDDGELKNVFLSDHRSESISRIYTAETAYLLRLEETTRLVLVSGMTQTLNRETQLLSSTMFDDLTYDVGQYFTEYEVARRHIGDISTRELFSDPEKIVLETGSDIGHLLEEAHGRFHKPLLCLFAALIGFAAVTSAGYSRVGSGRQILFHFLFHNFSNIRRSNVFYVFTPFERTFWGC